MSLKTQIQAKAALIKTQLQEAETALTGPNPDVATALSRVQRLHAMLNGLAQRAADHFGDDIETFSGGNDKPKEN